jgi:glycosyltransferase involved in cell wall biosynthesis
MTIYFNKFLPQNPNRVYENGLRFKNVFKTNTQETPLISIITVVKNRKIYVEETINSILRQKYKNFEYIIIDGHSNDGTLEILKKYETQIDYIVSEEDNGLYDAMNKGMQLCTGDIIGMVNSDDILMPDALLYLSEYLKKYPSIDFFFGSVKKHWGILHGFKPWKISYVWNFYSSHSTGFYIKKTAVSKLGKYSLKYKYCADLDYFYRMIVKHKMKGVSSNKDELFGIFRAGGISSHIDFWTLFFEKNQIRIDNKQNKYLVLILIITMFIFNWKRLKTLKNKNLVDFFKLNYLSIK